MNAAWVGLCGTALLVVWLLRDALTDMCKEEVKTRLERLPYAVLRMVALRIPRPERPDVLEEWRAELDYILSETDGLPITRLLRGVSYSVGMMGLMLPFADARQAVAAYWWRVTRRLRQTSWTRTYLSIAATIDGMVMLGAALLAFRLGFEGRSADGVAYLAVALSLPAVWILSVGLLGGYDARFIGDGTEEFRRVLQAGLSLTAALALVSYAVNNDASRVCLIASMQAGVVLDLVVRLWLRRILRGERSAGRCFVSVVAVGRESAVADFIAACRREPYLGLKVVAICAAGDFTPAEVDGVPVVGDLNDVPSVTRSLNPDMVAVFSCPEMDGVKLRTLAWELEKTRTDLCVAPALLAGPQSTVRPTAGLTLLHVDHPQLSGPRQVIKDLFDRSAAACGLLALSPLLLGVAVSIRLSDHGPALLGQTRMGKDGQPFKIYKFRTMMVDAEARLAELLPANESDGVLFKNRRDPRITAIGARLRKWSLDELPELINVLRGEMSLVGPRPPLPEEAARYADHVRRRLVVKPGLTGMWQVNGRSDLSWEESVRLDLRYIENWSFALDLQILWKTCSVIFRGTGAY